MAIQKLDRSKLDALIAGTQASRFASQSPLDSNTNSSSGVAFTPAQAPTEPSLFGRIGDVFTRGGYAVRNVLKDAIDQDPNTNNPLESFWAGLSGIDKTSTADIFNQYEKTNNVKIDDWFKGVAGFAGDMALDPVSYVPLGWVTKPIKAASTALSGEKALRAAVSAGEGLQESSKADIALQGAKFDETPKPPKVEQAAKEEVAAENTANVQAGRKDAATAQAAQDLVQNPVTAVPDIQDLHTTVPANVGVKTKPITLKGFDPVTLQFVREQAAKDLKHYDTAEEAGMAAAEQYSRIPNDTVHIYRSAFKDDPVLGPAIRKEIADSQPVVTPKVPDAVVPEQVNITPTGQASIPTPSQARLGNDYEQARITEAYTKRHRDAIRAASPGAKFDDTAPQIYDNVVNDLKVHKEDAIAAGNYPTVRLDDNNFSLHAADVLDSLGTENGVKLHLSKYENAATSSLLQGAAKAVEAKTGGLVGDDLLNAVKEQVIKADRRRSGVISATRAERVAKVLISHTDDFERRMIENDARFGKRDLVQGETIGAKTAEDVKTTLADPMSPTSSKINKVADVNGKIVRDGNQVGVSPSGQVIGAKRAAKDLEGTVTPTDTAGAREAMGAAKDAAKGTEEAAKKVKDRQKRQMNRDAKELEEDPNIKYVDIGEKIHANLQKGVHRAYSVVLNFVNHGFRQGDTADKYRWLRNAAEQLQSDYRVGLSKLKKTYTDDQLNAGFWALSSGIKPAADLEPVTTALKPFFDHLMDMGEGNVANIATRSGLSIDTFNELMKSKGLPEFQLPTTIKGNKNPTMADVWHLTKDWKVTGKEGDKLTDFMARLQSVGTEIATRQTVGTDLVRRFGSDTFKPGYVRIARMPYDRAPMSHFIDNKVFVPREIAYELSNFNRFIDTKTSFQGQKGGFAWFANNVLDPYTRLLKPTQTVFRPGHHVRNNVGDFSMNVLSGMNNIPKHYRNAGSAMLAMGRIRKDFEGSQELFKKTGIEASGKNIMSIPLKDGAVHTLDPGQFAQVAMRNGTVIGYKSKEDILSSEGKGLVTKVTDKIMESKPAEFAGKVSEDSGNLHRLAQLSHILSNPKFTKQFDNIDDAVQAANATISKFHPDLGGLAAGESKYGRRTLLYYTWMRQAIPTILAASLARPARIAAMPRAYYNAQIAMGMDPKNMQEPYENPGMLPDFLREGVGGQIGTHMFNLGTPSDTLADFFSHGEESNPIKSIGSFVGESINPLYTAIPDLIGGQDALSGKHITDTSDYLDQLVPGANQISALSGTSVTGTLGNVLGGTAGPMLDPQRATAVNGKTAWWNQNLANFMSGLQIQDTEYPSYRRLAGKSSGG